jgi:protein-tyrosine phosphatase
MAEYLFRSHIMSRPELTVCSAGVMTGYGTPASRYAVKAMNELGVDISAHRSQPVTRELAEAAERLVVMTSGHRDALLERFPQAAGKVVLLKSFDPNRKDEDVMDPIGLSLDVYRYVRDDIAGALWGLDRHLQEEAGTEPAA